MMSSDPGSIRHPKSARKESGFGFDKELLVGSPIFKTFFPKSSSQERRRIVAFDFQGECLALAFSDV